MVGLRVGGCPLQRLQWLWWRATTDQLSCGGLWAHPEQWIHRIDALPPFSHALRSLWCFAIFPISFIFSIVHQQNGFDTWWHKVAKCLLKNWLFLSTDSFICYKTSKSGWFKHILSLCFWVSSHQSPTSKDVVVQCDYCYICGLLLWEEWGWCHLRQIGPSNISLHISHHIFLFNKHALPFAPILNLYISIHYTLHKNVSSTSSLCSSTVRDPK